MNDSERIKNQDFVHLLIAIRRKKENRNLVEYCIRRVIRDEEKDFNELKLIVSQLEGVWRIYHTVNLRDTQKALKNTLSELILHPENASRVDSIWKSCLMKPECKAERKYLIDIDSDKEDVYSKIKNICRKNKIEILRDIKTPNGWHFVIPYCDTRIFHSIDHVEFHRDRYYFVALI